MDGAFGLKGAGVGDAMAGGLAGLVKTAAHEWAGVSCKAMDIAQESRNVDAIAEQIADEMLLKGPVEVGISRGRAGGDCGWCMRRWMRRRGEAAR